ncbi:MAG TPA: GntR family transcriptional regulator [Phycisphaerae bacterium]|jgi:GntR family transcriptional regulator
MLQLRITTGSAVPIYQQIVTQVRHAIAMGGVEEGALLPSVRALAEQLLINPNTVAKAYGDLSKDGLVEAVPGKGLAVAARRAGMGLTRSERLRRIEPAVTQLMHDAIALDLSAEDLRELLEKNWKGLDGGNKKPEAGGKKQEVGS